ncbi:class I SAM-dependent methyltransferase [Alphaproteobacteria bacterium]|nr:class I SAM-dependent methyltransferase [Alphaproteobacteria bacterium]
MSALLKIKDKFSYPYMDHVRSARPTQDVLATIDRDEFKKLLKYKLKTLDFHYQKYFNVDYWMRLNVRRALTLGLHRMKRSSVLDIGSGFGYFPYVARFYNHEVIGLDLPGDELFKRVSEFLELDIRDVVIQPQSPLPDFKAKFDLVTAFQICFNGHKSDGLWGVDEWRFFLEDLYQNHMNEGGRVYLEFNYEPAHEGWVSGEIKALFDQEYKARWRGPSRVLLSKG